MNQKAIWSIESKELSWDFGKVKKEYENPPTSVTCLSDNSGFVVVLSTLEFGANNAVLYNYDGSVRFWLTPPPVKGNTICFYDIYYVNDVLTAILSTSQCDFGCEIDEHSGNYLKIYVSR